jgi:hypothetical protein
MAADRRDRRAASDPAGPDEMEVVLAQAEAGDEQVGVGRRRAEGSGIARDVQDPLLERAAEDVAREQRALERGERRVPVPVRRHFAHALRDHVARLAARGEHVGGRREVGGDLQPADPVPVDEHAAAAERLRARVVEAVQELTREAVEAGRHDRLAKAAARDDDGVERLPVDLPAGRHAVHARVEADPGTQAELVGVRVQVVQHLRRRRMQREAVRPWEIAERGHRPARVRVHAGPDAAVRRAGPPLPAEIAGCLEHDRVEARVD